MLKAIKGLIREHKHQIREQYGYGELAFYRLTGSARRRKPKDDELPEGALDPIPLR